MALPDQNKQVLTITDFTPGIYSNGNFATNVPPAPIGAAQETNTYRCIGLPGGGLAPLPKLTQQYNITFPAAGTVGTFVGIEGIQGDRDTGGLSRNFAEEYIYIVIDVNTSPRRYYVQLFRSSDGTAQALTVANTAWPPTQVPTVDYVQHIWDHAMGVSTDRHAHGGFNTGIPMVVFGFPGTSRDISFHSGYHALTIQSILTHLTNAFPVISHQGRVVMSALAGNLAFGPVGWAAWVVERQMRYTQVWLVDEGFADDGTIANLGYDRGQLFGSWGSISTSEIIFIGATGNDSLFIQGDMSNPTITLLKGLQPTGRVFGRGLQSSMGLLYASEDAGVWAWQGGNSSQKVSTQLRDDFYERTTLTSNSREGETVRGSMWGKFAVYPNNFILDTEIKSWWRLEDTSVFNGAIWNALDNKNLFGLVDSMTSGSTNEMAKFSLGSPVSTYSWQSQPILVAPYGQTVRVTDIEIKAVPSVADTNQTITVTLTNRDNTTVTETITINSKTTIPVRERVPTAMRGDDIIVRIQADGGANPAPVIHSIGLVWDTGTPTA